MTLLGSDSLTQLAFSVYESKGIYALLLGSGLSRAASIPTGWEITLDLIGRVAMAQGVEEQPDWAAWYREKTGTVPDYSALLEELAVSREERRAILHRYIEPNDEDRERGRKIPTKAHRAVAKLVQAAYVRVIITTNFDRLLENALRECGVEPTVVASVDALLGAEPIAHSKCYILKLHGDYRDARILNTEAELSTYPSQFNALLDRILDEHGLIVCGWSGEWDHALRAAFLRTSNRRYPVFWTARGDLGDGAQELVKHREARAVSIADADGFFSTLQQRVETLEQAQLRNPLGVELLVGSAKRFVCKPEHRVQLDDLAVQELERVLGLLDSPDFAPQVPWDQTAFRVRVRRYEAAAEGLACLAGVLGRWGDGSEYPLVLEIIRSLQKDAERIGTGLTVFVNLRSYPAVLVFTAYGLAALRAGRLHALHRVFEAEVGREHREPRRAVEALFLMAWEGGEKSLWNQIEGFERRKTPLSDHLLDVFGQWAKRFVGPESDFELLFERYEMLGSLAHFEREEKSQVQKQIAGSSQDWTWTPFGRTSWDSRNAERLISEFQKDTMKAALVEAGFAKRDPEFVELFVQNFRRIAGRMRW